MFRSIKSNIRQFALRPGVRLKLQEQRVKSVWQEVVRSVNKEAVGKSEVSSLCNGKEIVVKTVNHIWLQEMFFYQEELKKKLKRYAKGINSIRFM